MRGPHFKKKLLPSLVAMSLAGITGAGFSAEDESDNDKQTLKDEQTGVTITVTGLRESLKRNLADKRDANAVVDVITAQDIGKFPDKNIAESLQRVPGVTINRGFAGEGNEVSIRGVDPQLTQTLVNGQFVASTSWFSLAFNRRSFNMDLMPSELVQSVVVYKSPVAEIDEGGVGGTVMLNTRKPLDLDPKTLYASVETMKNSLDSETATSANGLFSWKNEDATFGILATVSQANTIGRGNKAENYWEEAWAASGIAQFRQDRERDTFDINAQFAPTDRLSFGLHHFNTSLDATNTNQNFLLFGGCCDTSSGQSTFTNGSATVSPTTGIPMAGTLTGGSGNPGWAGWLLAQDVNSRRPEIESDLTDFTVDYDGNGYRAHLSVGRTTASGGNGGNINSLWGIDDDDVRWVENGGNLSVDFDFLRDTGFFLDVNNLDMADPDWQTNRAISLSETRLWDEEDWLQFDVDFDVQWGVFDTIKAGFKTRDHVFGKSQINSTVDQAAVMSAGNTLGSSGYFGGVINIDGGVLAAGSDTQIAEVDASFDAAVRANITGSEFLYAAFGEVEEEITAFYVQGDFNGDRYRGNVGLRYVTTDVNGSTYSSPTDPNSYFSREADYSDVLPSVNFAYSLSDEMIFRTSAAKVISRPAYGTVNPALSGINPTANTASSGNVGIDPFRANQFDAGIEYYFDDNNFLGAALFYKDIESFVSSGTTQALVYEPNGDQGAPNDLETYTLTVPVQGEGGHVQGIELNYQQMFGDFGLLANVTLSDSEGKTDSGDTFSLPGQSDLSYNLTGFYQTDVIEARLAYTFRDEFLAEGTAIGGALDTFDEQAFLDLSVTWHATDIVDLTFQGVNLTDEVSVQRHNPAASLGTNRVTTVNGSRYYLKASVRF